MPNLTAAKEQQIIDALKAKFAGVTGASNIITDMPVIDSKQDEIDLLTVQNVDDELEIKYCYLSFLGYADSETDGCDDMPVVFLDYNAHFFAQFKELRSDNSTSEKDFKAWILNTRNKFLEDNRTLLVGCEHTPLTQSGFIILGDDPLTGSYGHFQDLTLRVEIT